MSRYTSHRYHVNSKSKTPSKYHNEEEDDTEDVTEYNEISVQDNNIYFYTDVNPKSALELVLAITDLTKKMQILAITHNIPVPTITLHINSEGGEVHSALSVFDTIKRNPTPIKTIISGNASSAATIISLAGHERAISQNSYMLIHNISSGFWGKMHEFEDEIKNMTKLTANLKKIYKENTSITKTQLDNLLKKDLLLDAKTCVRYGLVDTIE